MPLARVKNPCHERPGKIRPNKHRHPPFHGDKRPADIGQRTTVLLTPLRRRHGAIFITALAIIVILSGLLIVFAQSMRTEALASANRLAYIQADAVERGAETWALAQTESYPADSITITQTPVEAVQLGGGYFWVLHSDPIDDQTYQTGITDESAKLNINVAGSTQLQLLPNMTPTAGDSIADWRSAAGTPRPNGAMSSYYDALQEPYQAKNAPYESVEELLLVQGVDESLLWGLDKNRNGYIDDAERNAGGSQTVTAFSNANGQSRGIFNDLTCYSVEPNTATSGSARINVNAPDTTNLKKALTKSLSASRADAITDRLRPLLAAARGAPAFATLGVFYIASGMTATEFGTVFDQLTTNTAKTLTGLVNVNTAPKEVLMTLPGLTDADADAIVAARTTNSSNTNTSNSTTTNSSGIGWLFSALSTSKAIGIVGAITARSYVYSADIVAVSGDGRAYKRVRIVIDSRTPPAKIIYRKDLTDLGWPLPPEIRASMRSGKGIITGLFASPVPGTLNGLSK